MANPGLTKAYDAVAAIPAYHLVKPSGVNDGEVIPASGPTDAIMGISSNVDAAIGQRADVVHSLSAELVAGGPIADGDPVTSDANGCGVKAVPAAGVNNRIVGFALMSAVVNDIIPVLIKPGFMQG